MLYLSTTILFSIGGGEENSDIMPAFSLIPKAATCSGNASDST